MRMTHAFCFAPLLGLVACGGGLPRNDMSAMFLNGQSELTAEYTEADCEFSVDQDFVSLNVSLSSPTQGLDTTNTMQISVHEANPGAAFSSAAVVQMNFLFSQLSLIYYNVRDNLSWIPAHGFPDLTDLEIGQSIPIEGALRIGEDTVLSPNEVGSVNAIPAQEISFSCTATVEQASEPTAE